MRKYGLIITMVFSACGHKLEGPSPELLDVGVFTGEGEPPGLALVCSERPEPTRIMVQGEDLAPLVEDTLTDPNAVLPGLTLIAGGTRYLVPEDGAEVTWVSRTEMRFNVYPEFNGGAPLPPTAGENPVIYDVEACNRPKIDSETGLPVAETGACVALPEALALVAPPVVASVASDLSCTAQGERTFTLTGTGFLGVKGAVPEITLSNASQTAVLSAAPGEGEVQSTITLVPKSCMDVGGPVGADVQFCTSLTFTLSQDVLEPTDEAEAYQPYEIVVTNPGPADCASADSEATLTLVPPPTATTVAPDLICTVEEAKTLIVSGANFLTVDGTLPTVTITDGTTTEQYLATLATGCSEVSEPAASPESTTDVDLCTSLTITVPMGDLLPANYNVTVINPDNTDPLLGCVSGAVTLTSVPEPAITTIVEDLTCTADGATVHTITGTGFLNVDGTLPTVNVGTDAPITPDSLTNCADLPGSPVLDETVQTCTTITFTLPQTATAGLQDVTVTNPDVPLTGPACTSNAVRLLVTADPVITGIVPPSQCAGAVPAQITINGTGFLVVDGNNPTATFNGAPATVASVSGCSALAGPPDIVETVQACTGIVLNVPNPAIPAGNYPVIISNPVPPGCSSAPFNFVVALPPTITDFQPNRVCEDLPMTYVVSGTEFTLASVVELDPNPGVPGDEVLGTVDPSSNVPGQLTVDFGPLNPGTYQLTVSNDGNPDGIGCDDVFATALIVEPTPFVFFADPPVVYNGISTQITVYATNINCDPDPPVTLPGDCIGFVGIGPAGGGVATIDLTASAVYDLLRPNRIQVVVPNIDPATTMPIVAGSYDVFFTDALGCMAAPLPNGLTVTDNVAMNLVSIDAPFGQTGVNTSVTITVETPSVAPFTADFDPTPRAYLNPVLGGTAAAVRAVAFVSDATITGIAPAGPPALAPGLYDVIVVNPDGTVGVSSQAVDVITRLAAPFSFTVTAAPPPTIANLTPGSIPSDTGQAVTIEGANFDNPCPGTCPTVVFTCRDPVGALSNPPLTVDASTAATIDVTIDASGLADGTVCTVRVTNADGSYGDYSALSITNPSQNINNFTDTTQALNFGRRAPAAVAGRATNQARFIYAIGGDDGTAIGAMDSIEAASVSTLGVLSPWRVLPGTLPAGEPRTLAGSAVLDHAGRRFIYLVGGNDGTVAVNTVLRAEVLDPTRSPEIVNLDFTPDASMSFVAPGVPPGIWNYKVAAIFDVVDAENPDGESLPSDVQPVTVPAMPSVDVTIEWSAVPNAIGYRIYRSPTPGLGTGTEELLATVGPTTSYTDTGNDVTDPAEVPHDIGDLGNWATVGTLNTPREGVGAAIAADPDTADGFFLYALGGRDDTPAVLDSYEVAAITVNPLDGTQAVGAFTEDAANTLTTAVWQLGAYGMDHAQAQSIPAPDTYVYALGGIDATNGSVTDAQGALVGTDGTLGAWVTVDNMNPARGGFGAVGANNFLLAIAGGDLLDDPTPITSSRSVLICAAGGGTCEGGPPNLENWNNDPATMICNRYLMGTARESATIFLIGGATDGSCLGGSPTTSTESTAW